MAEPMNDQERDGEIEPQGQSSKELFSQLIIETKHLDQKFGGKLLRKVDFSENHSVYVFPYTEMEGSGFGISSYVGPVFVDSRFTDEVYLGKNYRGASKVVAGDPISRVEDEDIERWSDGARVLISL